MPARGRLPQLLVIAGSAVVLVATGSFDWLFWLTQPQEPAPYLIGVLVTLSNAIIVAGSLLLGAGFALPGLRRR